MSFQWNQITHVLFDVGNTLFTLDHARIIEIAQELGFEVSSEEISRAEAEARKAVDALFEADPETDGVAVWQTFFGTFLTTMGIPEANHPILRARFSNNQFESSLWSLASPDVPEILHRLVQRGYRLAVVSNADGHVEDLLKGAGIADYFEAIIDSTVVGVEKPNPRIFQFALDQIGAAAKSSCYVGDSYSIDFVGAEKAGLHPVLLDPFGIYESVGATRILSLQDLLGCLRNPIHQIA